MTLYTTTYQIVESPLNEDFEPFLRISNRELPVYPESLRIRKRDLFIDPVQVRMLFILAFVLLMISAFAAFIAPRKLFNIQKSTSIIEAQSGEPAVAAVIQPLPQTGLSPVFSKEVQHWRPEILAWSAEHGVDPDIVATIMQIESCGDPKALSHAGAQGLFQVMPFHFAAGEDMLDPNTNARRGLNYYAQQLRETKGNVFLSFAGYNGGSAASSSQWDAWAHETQRYYVWSKGIYEEAKAGLSTSPTLQRWMEAGGASLCRQASSRLGLQ